MDNVQIVDVDQCACDRARRERAADGATVREPARHGLRRARPPSTSTRPGRSPRSAGEWIGTWTEPDGKLEIGGTYQAQWRKVDGQWLIQAELVVPARCAGSKYCSQRP